MTCGEYHRYLDGLDIDDLTPEIEEAMGEHLELCGGCLKEFEELEQTIGPLLRENLPPQKAPSALKERIIFIISHRMSDDYD